MAFHAAPSGGALLLALFPIGCSDDDNPASGGGGGGTSGATIPASWAGSWQITTTPTSPLVSERGGGSIEVGITSLCAGLPVEELLGEGDIGDGTCTGTWTDNSVDVTCTGTGLVAEGCTGTFSQTLRLQRVGDRFSGTLSGSITYVGTCDAEFQDETFGGSIDAVRLDTDQFGCDENLDREVPASWGGNWTFVLTPVERDARGDTNVLLCPGEDIDSVFWEPWEDTDAVGGFTETTAQVSGSYTVTGKGCLEIYSDQWDLTRTNDSITGTRTSTTRTVTDPNFGGGQCSGETTQAYTVAGTRTDMDLTGCSGRSMPELRPVSIQDLMRFPRSRR